MINKEAIILAENSSDGESSPLKNVTMSEIPNINQTDSK